MKNKIYKNKMNLIKNYSYSNKNKNQKRILKF